MFAQDISFFFPLDYYTENEEPNITLWIFLCSMVRK